MGLYFHDNDFFLGPFGLPDGVPGALRRCRHEGQNPIGVFNDKRISLKRSATTVARVVREEFHQRNSVFGGVFLRKGVGSRCSARHNKVDFLCFLDFGDLAAEEVVVGEFS